MHRPLSWGRDGREGYFSPLFLFIGSLTTARTAAVPPPLSCLPRLPPLSPSAARRNSMPIRFGAQRQPDQRPDRGAGGSRVGEPSVLPQGRGTHPVPCSSVQGQTGEAPPAPSRGSENRVGWMDKVVSGGTLQSGRPPGSPRKLKLGLVSWRAWPLGGAVKDFGNKCGAGREMAF